MAATKNAHSQSQPIQFWSNEWMPQMILVFFLFLPSHNEHPMHPNSNKNAHSLAPSFSCSFSFFCSSFYDVLSSHPHYRSFPALIATVPSLHCESPQIQSHLHSSLNWTVDGIAMPNRNDNHTQTH